SANIALAGTRFDGQGITQNGTANADGTYTLNNLPAGDYAVTATKGGYRVGQVQASVDPGAAENAGNINLVAQRGGINGTVQVGGVAQGGAQVTVSGTSTIGQAVNQTVTSGADGTFAFAGVLAGTYSLTISLADHNPSSQQVTVASDSTTAVGTVTLAINPGSVSGTVALEGGGNPSGATVTVDGGSATNPAGTGAYTIAGLKAGTHTVAASLTGYYPASTTVVVVAGQSVVAPNLTLMRARGKVVGLVELVGEASDEGALVAVTKGGQRWATTSDATGAFEIAGVPADNGYEVTAGKEGFLSKKVTGVTVEADVPEDVGTFVLERMTGDFNFLHCQHWTPGDKQMVSVLGLSYVTACDAGGGPRVRLELSPPADTTKVSWALTTGFDPEPGTPWNPADPPEVALGATSGIVRVYVRYWIGTQSQWTFEYSAGVFVDREIPVIDVATVQNDPAYLTPTKTYMDLSVAAHDPMSGSEDGSGVEKYLLVVGGGACPADPGVYLDIPGDVTTGTEVSVQVVTNPGTEPEGIKTVKVCVLDAAGNLANPADRTIIFDKTPPAVTSFAFFLDRTDNTAETLVGTRNVVLKAGLTTLYAPLAGVAYAASDQLDCATATYETPDVISDVPAGDQHDYVVAKDWFLSGNDGTKDAYVCAKDAAGNAIGTRVKTSPSVQLDTAGPATCAITLKGGAPATNAADLTVAFGSGDPSGEVYISGDVDGAGALPVNQWITFAANPAELLRLSGGDGVKTVTVKCRDTVQNESGMSFATIMLDTVPPGGFVTIDDGAGYSQDKDVRLTLTGIDDRTGVDKMKMSNDGTPPDCGNPGGYVPFASAVSDWSLIDSEGARTVTACFMDGAGNTAQIGSDSIFLDKTDPDGNFTLNGGDQYVNTLQVMAGFSGVSVDVAQMKLSNASMTCGTETGYQSYQPVAIHTLLPGLDGNRTVYACLKDASGRVNAATISDSINYDTTPPVVTGFALAGGEYTAGTAASATLSASGASKVRFTGDISAVAGGAVGEWMDIASPQGFTFTTGDGLKTVSAQFKDDAGNVTAPATDSVTLDQTAPVATLSVNNGASETGTAIVTLYVTASADVVEMALDDDDTGGLVDCGSATYQPYTPVVTYTLSAPASGQDTVVKVCVKDRAGLAGFATDGIVFDNTPPAATSIEINGGAAYTQVTGVNLTSIVYSGATQMYVDGDVEVASGKTFEWITAAGSLGGLTLTTSNGLKMVRARFRDAIGNVSSTVSDFITLDNVPPALGEVTILDGDVTNSANVALTLFASEAAEMCVFGDVSYDADGPGGPNPPVSHDSDNVADCTAGSWWVAYTTALPDGVVIAQNTNAWNYVRVAYRDAAGNVSAPAMDSIYLDQTLPSLTVRTITGTVADGQTSTTLSGTQNVTLSWTVTNAGRVTGGAWDGAGTPAEMAFANVTCGDPATACSALSYEPYASSKGWTLSVGTAPDGANRCVDYCFKDQAGNYSASGRGQISLDLVAPSAPTLGIDQGGYATSTSITADLNVTGATQYYVEGDVTDTGSTFEWVTPGSFPVNNLGLTLTSAQGNKVVMARYRDAAGNVSAAAIDSIELDTSLPTGTLSINSAAAETGNPAVTLSLTASADTAYAYLANDDAAPYCDLNCASQTYTTPFSTTLVWNLSAGDGTKYVCACFKDTAGNISAAAASDSISLDTTAPVATSVTINNGDATTQSAVVNLTLISYSGAAQMYVDGDVDISAGKTFEWTTAAGSLNGVPLTNSNGLKTVMVRFRDSVGNVSSTVSDMITLDNQAPGTSQVTINEGEVANSANLALTLYASDAVQMCVYGDVAYDADGPGGNPAVSHDSDNPADCTTNNWWVAYTTGLADGVVIAQNANAWNYVRVAYKDGAGNVSAEVNDKVYLDQALPVVTVRTVTGTVADGQTSTTLSGTQNVTLSWTVTNAGRVSGGAWDGTAAPLEMAFANVDCAAVATDCSSLSFEPYASSKGWTLSVGTAPDGANRCVDYCFKDQAGNYTASGRGQISLDLVAPSAPTLSIDQGEYATSASITADLNATGATQYYVEGDVTDTASTFEWIASAFPVNNLGLTLSGADGTKVVMARYRDAAGNVSAAAIDTIQLDTAKPAGTVSIDSGASKTTTQAVTLSLTASSDTAYVYLANDDTAPYCDATSIDCAAQTYTTPFSAAIAWNLSGGDGAKYVCACYRDRAGNTSVGSVSDSITLDTTPPAANSVEMAGGATYTTSQTVNLTTISATDAAQMYVDGDVEISAGKTFEWITYAGSLNGVPLTASNGLKMVRVRFRDDVGNVSATVSDFITYDNQAPGAGTVTVVEGENTNSPNLTTAFFANDATQMCVFGDVSYDADGPGGAAPVSHDSDNPADCTTFGWWQGYVTSLADGFVLARNNNAWNNVRVVYKDAAGNESIATTDQVYLDTTAPAVTSVTISGAVADGQGSATLTGTTSVKLTYSVTGGSVINGTWTPGSKPVEMAFANAGCGFPVDCAVQSYIPYTDEAGFTLSAGNPPEGTRCVDFCFKDQAGNISTVVEGQITLDMVAPTAPTLGIDQGEYATSTSITADLNVTGASQYFVEGDVTDTASTFEWVNAGAWPVNNLGLTLSGTDATKVVMAKYRDAAGNVSTTAIDTIVLDTAQPSGTVSINSGAQYTNSQLVTLSLSNVSPDVTNVDIKDSTTVCTDGGRAYTTPYSASIVYSLLAGEGAKTVYVCFKDRAGNKSAAQATDGITLDTVAPSNPAITIDNGAAYANTTAVVVDITSGEYPVEYYVEGNVTDTVNTFEWKSAAAAVDDLPVALVAVEGQREVRVKLRDAAGNESYAAFDTIVYDATDPSTGTMSFSINDGAGYTNNRVVDIQIHGEDPVSGIQKYRISRSSAFGGTIYQCGVDLPSSCTTAENCTFECAYDEFSEVFTGYELLGTTSGTKYVYLRVQDGSGRWSPTTWTDGKNRDTIYYDGTLPSLTSMEVRNSGGASTEFVNSGSVRVYFTGAADAQSGLEKFCINNDPPGLTTPDDCNFSSGPAYFNFTLTPGEGVKTVRGVVRDNGGNFSGTVSDTITLDTTQPQVLAFATTTPFVQTTTASFTISAADNLSATNNLQMCRGLGAGYSCSSCSWEAFNAAPTWAGFAFAPGPNSVALCLRDQAGNVTATPSFVSVTYDTTDPSAPVLATPVTESGIAHLTWSAAADAESGIDHYEIIFSAVNFPAVTITPVYTTTYTITDLKNYRPYTIRVEAVNKAGLRRSSNQSSFEAVPGWNQDTLTEYDNYSPVKNLFAYNGILYLASQTASPYTTILYTCDTKKTDCVNGQNWEAATVNTDNPAGIALRMTFGRLYTDAKPFLYMLYGYNTGALVTTLKFLRCSLNDSECRNAADWNNASYPAGTIDSDAVNGLRGTFSAGFAYDGTRLAAMYIKDNAGTDELTTAVCPLTTTDCTASAQWSKVFHGAMGTAYSNADLAFIKDRLAAAKTTTSALTFSICDVDTNCDAAGDWASYDIDLNGRNRPRIASDGGKIWIAYQPAGGGIRVAWCDFASTGCNAAGNWQTYDLDISDVSNLGEFTYSRGILHLVNGYSNLHYASCDVSTGCDISDDWNEFQGLNGVDSQLLYVGIYGMNSFDNMVAVTETDPFIASPMFQPAALFTGHELPVPGGFVAGPALDQVHLQWRKVGNASGYKALYGAASRSYTDTANLGSAARELDLSATGDVYVTLKSKKVEAMSDATREVRTRKFTTYAGSPNDWSSGGDGVVQAAVLADQDGSGPALTIRERTGGEYRVQGCSSNCENDANWTNSYPLFTDSNVQMTKGASSTTNLLFAAYNGADVQIRYCPTTTSCDAAADWYTITKAGDQGVLTLDAAAASGFMNVTTCTSEIRTYDSGTGGQSNPAGNGSNDFDTNDAALNAALDDVLYISSNPDFPTTRNLGGYRITGISADVLTLTEFDGTLPSLVQYPAAGGNVGWEIYRPVMYAATGTLDPAFDPATNDFQTNVFSFADMTGKYLIVTHGDQTGLEGIYYIYRSERIGGGPYVWVKNLDGSIPTFANEANVQFAIVEPEGYLRTHTCTAACTNAANLATVDQISECNQLIDADLRGPRAAANSTYLFVIDPVYDQATARRFKYCSWGSGCNAPADFSTSTWLSSYNVPYLFSFDYSPSTQTFYAVGQYQWMSTQQMILISCDYPRRSCTSVNDWTHTPIDWIGEDAVGAGTVAGSGGTMVLFSTTTLMKGVICFEDCHRQENWTSYVMDSSRVAPVSSRTSGPIVVNNNSGYIHAVMPRLPSAGQMFFPFFSAVGGVMMAQPDP
ncbi:MAG: carboxypeptidase regulatory-like domain-containing protein, partial [Deltaproteobacteria bacterium]|nr:carboxypeptidase regulatory-like domain-containing protein [Deltaproteobacteria bacterium]